MSESLRSAEGRVRAVRPKRKSPETSDPCESAPRHSPQRASGRPIEERRKNSKGTHLREASSKRFIETLSDDPQEREKLDLEATVSKLSAELLAQMGKGLSRSKGCFQVLDASATRLRGEAVEREAVTKLRDGVMKTADREKVHDGKSVSRSDSTIWLRSKERIRGEMRPKDHRVKLEIEESEEARDSYLESQPELHRSSSEVGPRPDEWHPEEGRHQNPTSAPSGGNSQADESLASKGSGASSSFKDRGGVEQLNEHKSLIAGLGRSRAELAEERDALVEKCGMVEGQVLSLQRNIDELGSQLGSGVRENEDKPSRPAHEALRASSQRGDNFMSEKSTQRDHNGIMQELRAFYNSMLIKTRDMFDERLASFNEKLSMPRVGCENDEARLPRGQVGIQEQRDVIAELRRQIEALMEKAEAYSENSSRVSQDPNHEQSTELRNELEEREEQEQLKGLLEEALLENEELKGAEAEHLKKIENAEARIADLEKELRCASERLEENGRLFDSLYDNIDEDRTGARKIIARTSRSTSHTNAFREAENDRKSLADRIDMLFSGLLTLEQELRLATARKEESADQLAECLQNSELLKCELVEKSQQTVNLIEKLETAQAGSGLLKETVSKMRELCGEQLENCEPLLTNLTDNLKKLGRDRTMMSSQRSETAEELETKAELHRIQKRLWKYEGIIESSLKNCKVFADAFDLSIDPNLSLGEFVATMMQSFQVQWDSREAELREKTRALAELREEVEQTVCHLKTQLEIRDHSLQSLQEKISAQVETIIEMENKRDTLEDMVKDLRMRSESNTTEFQEAEAIFSKNPSTNDSRCMELEGLLKTTIEQKDMMIADLQKQLAIQSNDFDRMHQELKTIDAFAVMRQRLNSLLDEITSCHRQMDSLTQGIVDRDQKIREKNRIVQNLTKELDERAASHEEMHRQLNLKGQGCIELRENLLRTEEKLCRIANQVLAGEAILGHIVDKVLPSSGTQATNDSWESLSEDIVHVVDNLVDAASRTGSLEEELNALRRMLEKLSPDSRLVESRISEVLSEDTESLEYSLAALETLPQGSEKMRAELARTLENLKIVKSEKILLQRTTQDIQSGQVEEVSNLKKLLTDTEAAMVACKEENEQLRAFLNCGAAPSDKTEETSFHFTNFMKKLEGLEKEKAVLRTDLADVQAQLEKAKIETQNKTLEIEKLKEAFSARQSDMNQFEGKLQSLKERFGAKLRSLRDELASAHTEKMSLTAKLSALKKHIEETQFEKENMICKIQELESQVLKLANRDLVSKSNVRSLSEKFRAEDLNLPDLRSAAGLSKQMRNGKDISGREKDSVIQELKLSLRTTEESLRKMTDNLKAKCREAESLKQEIALQNADLRTLHSELGAVRSENSNLSTFIDLLRKWFCSGYQDENTTDSLSLGAHDLDGSLKTLLEELETYRSQMQSKVARSEDIRRQLQESEAALLLCRDANDRLEKELALKTEKFEELKKRLQASSEELRRVTLEDDETKRRLEKELNSMRRQLSPCSSSRDTASRGKASPPPEIEVAIKRKSKSLKAQLQTAELEMEHTKTSLRALIRSKEALEDRCQQLAEQCEVKERVIKRMTEQVSNQEKLLLDGRAEVEKVRTVSDKFRYELEEARELLRTSEKHRFIVVEIQRNLGIRNHEEILPFLEHQGVIVSELGKGVLKIRAQLNGHESELEELRKTVSQQENDLSKIIAGIGKKFKLKRLKSERGSAGKSRFGAKHTEVPLIQASWK